MVEEHANVSLIKRLDLTNLAGCAGLFAQHFVWHFFNPRLPEVQGDYVGPSGLRTFFEKLGALSDRTFQIEPVSLSAIGDELVVAHTRNRMVLEGRPIKIDAVTVWRIVDGQIAEVWDIPSIHSVQP